VLLIVEDDPTFARILIDMARERGLKALAALRGATAIALAREFRPHVITLDISLPDMAGWTILDRLKHDPSTRHIPVHVITGDENRRRALALGAMTFLQKAAEQQLATAFAVIGDSAHQRTKTVIVASADAEAVSATIAGPDLEIVTCNRGGEVLRIAAGQSIDGIIADLVLPDMHSVSLIESLQTGEPVYIPPVIVISRTEPSQSDLAAIGRVARNSAVRYAATLDRLLDEAVVLLHRPESQLLESQRQVLSTLHETDPVLTGKKVLVVDDDLRNIFALTSLLEHHDIEVVHAENGRAGIEMLRKTAGIDIVLMDIMMPEMDGYETMRAIRQIPQFASLPIIALTAKAMKGDREKCIEAGASDYVTKPVELEQLFSVMRVWVTCSNETPGLTELAAATNGGWSGLTEHAALSAEADFDAVEDDRNNIEPGDPVLLIVEDDLTFAGILVGMAHDRGLRALVAVQGNAAIALAREFRPNAITLDITLPDMAGWAILDRIKHDPHTRHIPVHIISGDENRRRGLALGAMTYLEKAVDQESLADTFGIIRRSAQRRKKKILVVTEDGDDIEKVIGGEDLSVIRARSAPEALAVVNEQYLDGLILDLHATELRASELVAEVQARVRPYTPPVVVYGPQEQAEVASISRLVRVSPVRYAASLETLLDETVVLLNRAEESLSSQQQRMISEVRATDPVLAGKRVLVVDDDVRNIFALTSVLQHHNIEVLHAENGRAGIELLKAANGVSAVLMDIMMPEMDGYETIRAIRAIPAFEGLPIVALTAKAMKGDREKCIDAGASDYVAKPVDLDQLFSVIRVCIARSAEGARSAGTGKE
jgi:CheY-like chemotaxis protein